MSKEQVIAAIRRRNRSVSEDYLVHFDEQTLSSYLQRLTSLSGRRGRNSRWIRQTTDRSIVSRAHR